MTLFQLRQKSPLRYEISPKLSRDVFEIILYSAPDGVHMDFVKKNDKKTVLITLTEEQSSTLRFIRPMIQNAVKRREYYNYDLGGNVRVTHEKFRKVYYVMLRQWYSDDKGDYQPSLYGVNIPHEVWLNYTTGDTVTRIGE